MILLLPVLSFLVLALAGMKMSHRAAGLIGSLSLGAVAVLSYATAYGYFTLPRLADGTFGTLITTRTGPELRPSSVFVLTTQQIFHSLKESNRKSQEKQAGRRREGDQKEPE